MERKELDIVLYTAKEAAAIIGCTPLTIKNNIKNGKLKAAMVAGKWRITKEDLEAYCKGK